MDKPSYKVKDKWGNPRHRDLLRAPSVDVWYGQPEPEDELIPGQGLLLFYYDTCHVPTNKCSGPAKLVCHSLDDANKLMACWNNLDTWKYKILPDL